MCFLWVHSAEPQAKSHSLQSCSVAIYTKKTAASGSKHLHCDLRAIFLSRITCKYVWECLFARQTRALVVYFFTNTLISKEVICYGSIGFFCLLVKVARHMQSQELPTTTAKSEGPNQIPRILHYVYLSGFDAYLAETEKPKAKMAKWQYDSCVEVHPHWEVMFWTQQMAEELITEHYSWFLPVWSSYEREVRAPRIIYTQNNLCPFC